MKPRKPLQFDYVPKGGMSDYQIAKKMGITRQRVFQIRERAMRKLKQMVKDDPNLARDLMELIG